jgi:hypothetical protein
VYYVRSKPYFAAHAIVEIFIVQQLAQQRRGAEVKERPGLDIRRHLLVVLLTLIGSVDTVKGVAAGHQRK